MRRRIKYVVFAVIFVGIVVFYYLFNPAEFKFMPKCMFHELTGWDCPGCGSQRMLHALLHGNIAEAWHHNALFVALIPILIPMVYLEFRKGAYPKAYARMNSVPVILTIAFAIITWGIVRNII